MDELAPPPLPPQVTRRERRVALAVKEVAPPLQLQLQMDALALPEFERNPMQICCCRSSQYEQH